MPESFPEKVRTQGGRARTRGSVVGNEGEEHWPPGLQAIEIATRKLDFILNMMGQLGIVKDQSGGHVVTRPKGRHAGKSLQCPRQEMMAA